MLHQAAVRKLSPGGNHTSSPHDSLSEDSHISCRDRCDNRCEYYRWLKYTSKVWFGGLCDALVTHALTWYQQCVGTCKTGAPQQDQELSYPQPCLKWCVKEDAALCRYRYLLTVFSVAAAPLCTQPSSDHSTTVPNMRSYSGMQGHTLHIL